MKILLIGAGSVGTYFCGRAALAGAQIEVVAHREFDRIAADGYEIESIAGNFHFAPSRVIRSAGEVSPDIDAVILATKVLPETDRISLLAPAAELPHRPPLMLIQNGIGIEDEISAAFPGNEIISAVAYIGASRKDVNHILHTGAGRLIIGRFGGGKSDFAEKIAALFNSVSVPCEVVENIALERWRKLLWNLPFNPVSVLGGGLDSRELCDGSSIEELCSHLMDEIIEIANGCGVPLTREMADGQIEYTRNFPPYKTSMLQDFEAGRSLEVDAVIGNAVKIADRLHLNVPYVRCCAALLASCNRKNTGETA